MKRFLKIFLSILIFFAILDITTIDADVIYDWTNTGTIETNNASPRGIYLAINDSTLISAWLEKDETNYYPRYATWNGADWSTTGTIELSNSSEYSISIAVNNTTTVAAWLEKDGTNYYPRYAIWNGSDWSNTGTIELTTSSKYVISVELNETTTVISWLEEVQDGPPHSYYPRYATWETDHWTTGTIELTKSSEYSISVALNNTTTIITWLEEYDTDATQSYFYPRYATWNGFDWSNTGTIEYSDAYRSKISVAMSETTTVVSWMEYVSDSIYYPRYAFWSGTDWGLSGTIEHYDSAVNALSVALNQTTTSVAWLEGSTYPFYPRYATFDGVDWSTSGTIEKSYPSHLDISLALNNTSTVVAWLEKVGSEYYPRYAFWGISRLNQDDDEIPTYDINTDNDYFSFETFGWFTYLIRIPHSHTTHAAHHNDIQLPHVHYHDNIHYVEDPDPDKAKTLHIKEISSGDTIKYLNVPAAPR